jgi:hypothetical protein
MALGKYMGHEVIVICDLADSNFKYLLRNPVDPIYFPKINPLF